MLEVAAILGLIFMLAFLVETLVEFVFGTIAGFLPKWEPEQRTKTSIIQTAAVMVGLGGAFLYRFDLLYLFGTFARITDGVVPLTPYGMAITGIAIGKGSNYVHQVIQKFFPVKSEPVTYASSISIGGNISDDRFASIMGDLEDKA